VQASLDRQRPVGLRVSVLPPLASIMTSNLEVLDVRGLPGRFVTADGEILANHAWHQSLARAAVCT